eukprot:g3174.t1
MINWEESREMCVEVENLFGNGEDLATAKRILHLKEQITNLKNREENVIASSIRALSEECETAQLKIDEHNLAQHRAKMKQLEAEHASLLEQIKPLESEEECTVKRANELEKRLKRIEQKIEKLREDTPKLVKRLNNSYSLYFSITNIVWDKNPTKLAGVIDVKDEGKLREFDVSNMSPFEAANKLWKIIAAKN